MLATLALSIVLMFDPCAPGGEAPNLACFSQDPETVARLYVEHHFPAEAVERAMDIAWCESRYVVTAANPTSSARGLFQQLRGWWSGSWGTFGAFDPFDPNANVAHAAYLYEHNGWSDWYASSHCWS